MSRGRRTALLIVYITQLHRGGSGLSTDGQVLTLDEVIEPFLLLQDVVARRFGGLTLQGQMHPFVPPVLLRAAGLATYAELSTGHGHLLAFQDTGNKTKSLVHVVSLIPRHLKSPPNAEMCNLCARNKTVPMCPKAQKTL